jgi:hypothetical protein
LRALSGTAARGFAVAQLGDLIVKAAEHYWYPAFLEGSIAIVGQARRGDDRAGVRVNPGFPAAL